MGTEWHVLIECTNKTLFELRNTLKNKLIQLVPQYCDFAFKNIIEMEILTINEKTTFYFANFLSISYSKRRRKKTHTGMKLEYCTEVVPN